jgi:hypothetical protein
MGIEKQKFSNNAATVLSDAITNVATSISVVNGSVFPSLSTDEYFYLTLIGYDGNGNEDAWEIIKVTARSVNLLTVVRGQDGTTAQGWPQATRVELRLNAGTMQDVAVHTHSIATTSAHGLMSSTDKTKLDGVAESANNYTHPSGDGDLHVPATGTTSNGKVLKASSTAGSGSWQSLTKTDVGLANVDNTSDANKPISTATQTALNGKSDTSHGHTALSTLKLTTPRYTVDADGNKSSTWAIDYSQGPVITATATGNITSITISNWPASGTAGHLKLLCTNFGAYTITFPTAWKFVKSDLTLVTFANTGKTLPASGVVIMDLVTIDGGINVYVFV